MLISESINTTELEKRLKRNHIYKIEQVSNSKTNYQFQRNCNGTVVRMGRRVKNTRNQWRFTVILSVCDQFKVGERYKLNFHPSRFKLTLI